MMNDAERYQLHDIQIDVARRHVQTVEPLADCVERLIKTLTLLGPEIEEATQRARRSAYERDDMDAHATVRVMDQLNEDLLRVRSVLYNADPSPELTATVANARLRDIGAIDGERLDLQLQTDVHMSLIEDDNKLRVLLDDGAMGFVLNGPGQMPAVERGIEELQRRGVPAAYDWSERLRPVTAALRQQLATSWELHHASRSGLALSDAMLQREHQLARETPAAEGPELA